jgi:hypothetical protein
MVAGDRHHAEALREEVAAVLAPLGLRLSPEKTRVVHIDEGFGFLGYADLRVMPTSYGNSLSAAANGPMRSA